MSAFSRCKHDSRPIQIQCAARSLCACWAGEHTQSCSPYHAAADSGCAVLGCDAGPAGWVDRFAGKPRKGSDILVQALEREGVDTGGLLVQHVIVS